MGIFGIFKKKKASEPALPVPPPGMKAEKDEIVSELPEVKGRDLVPEVHEGTMPAPQPAEIPAAATLEEKSADEPKPVYVSVQDYRAMIESADYIKEKLAKTDELITRIQQLKKHGSKELEHWKIQLDAVEKKLVFVEEALSEE